MKTGSRVGELDALRGIAAMLVVLFHFTTKYQELFGHSSSLKLAMPWGHLGVNLFFMISGFVIFMTLARTCTAADFLVSRFSRLYPAYWVAVGLTFGLTTLLGLPGKTVGIGAALANLSMVQGFFKVPHVDGVYWTLEVELLFYAWALLTFKLGWLSRVHVLLALLFVLRLIYFGFEQFAHISLPYIAYRLLILQFIPWFAAGIMVFRLASGAGTRRRDLALLGAAVVVLAIVDSVGLAALAAACALLMWAAVRGSLKLLAHPVLVWLGAISYTLYLLHENIGWALIRRAEQANVEAHLAIALALGVSLLLATALTRWVEQPAMRWIRQTYKARQQASRSGIAAPPH